MLIIDIYGAPGAGKSTTSAGLFSVLKDRGEKVSLISEAATDLIEAGQEHLLKDFEYQVYITSLQFKKIKDQERLGTEYLITDSPVLHQLNFIRGTWLHQPMTDLYTELMRKYDTFSVLVLRGKQYSTYKRVTTDEESMKIQEQLIAARKYEVTVPGRVTEVPTIVTALDAYVARR